MHAATLLELTRRYSEPHRHYHSLEHIAQMLTLGRDQLPTDEQIAAIWFHDAVYDVRRHDNEERSAALAVELLRRDGWPDESVDAVERMVLDTKPHEPSIEESKLVLDLDLWGLALPWAQFLANGRRIRREYSWLSDAEHDAGLRGFLERFLARERIYFTPWAAKREAAARRNLSRRLRELD
jgi:predicted metal-dependent HD superfamily phosphohydrolase